MQQKPFPDDFMWGASTAGHQVEGGNYDQWTVWEAEHAKRQAAGAHARLKGHVDWKAVKSQAEDPRNYVSGKGVDHYRLYRQDFDLLQQLQLDSFRFSIEWSRIEPEEGVWDQAAIDHYHNYIAELKGRGIEPVVNLWHWTHPVWFEDKGGFARGSNVGYFLRFVTKFAEEFGSDVRYVITLNEPNNYFMFGYLTGRWPPQKRNPMLALWVFWNLKNAHNHAYTLLKHTLPDTHVGVAYAVSQNLPKRPNNTLDKLVAKTADYAANWWFLNRIRRHQDFLGINYYFTNYYEGFKMRNPDKPHSDMGWHMDPAGVSEVILKAWLRYHKPIFVTENGVADAADAHRKWWLKETMLALHKARRAGADLRGYFHWSLLDNFEWDEGWWPKFGLVAVDRDNGMKRTVRPSAAWWAKQLRALKDSRE